MMKMKDDLLKSGERLVDLLVKQFKLIQNDDYFCFAVDAVLLANFAKIRDDSRVIELGTATGVIPHLVYAKNKVEEIIGIDIQSDLISMAKRSSKYNAIADKLKFYQLDLRKAVDFFGVESFDYLISNPPYFRAGSGKVSSNPSRALARYELKCNLEQIIKVSKDLLKFKGKAAFIYRTQRLAELLSLMEKYNLRAKRLQMIYPDKNSEAKLFLVEAQKGANTGLEVLPPLILNKQDGEYTVEIKELFYPEG